MTLCWLTCSVTDSRLTRSRKWRWDLKHLHPPSGEPAPFKVSYTSESSLFIITRQTNSGCQSGQEKSPHWIRTWWLARSPRAAGNYYLINCAFFHICSAANGLWSHHFVRGENSTRQPHRPFFRHVPTKTMLLFFPPFFDWKTMRQIKRKQTAGRHSVPLCSWGTEDANTRGFNQLERNVSGSVLHSQSPHVSALLHICSPI